MNPSELEALVLRLQEVDSGERRAIEQRLGALDAEELRDYLEYATARSRRNGWIEGLAMIGTAVAGGVGGLLLLGCMLVLWQVVEPGTLVCLTGIGLGLIGAAYRIGAPRSRGFDAGDEIVLGRLQSPAAVIPLLDYLERAGWRLSAQIEGALARLLPRLREEDYALIGSSRRRVLNRLVASGPAWHENEVIEAGVQALAECGDQESLLAMDRLLLRTGLDERDRRLLATANEAAARLRSRLEEGRRRNHLLRPCAGEEESLLRAAVNGESEDSALLRPLE